MILTPLKIQLAIIKAWYSIALKSVKYYGGLAIGINNECLLKEARLLRKYVEILKNFKIIGSTINCSCCVEGEYTVLLNDLSELTEAKIQFNCDGTGYMYFNSTGYPFNYGYDEINKTILINFTTLIDPSTTLPYELFLEDVQFTDNCSFTVDEVSPIEEALVDEVTGIPVTIDNFYGTWDGDITIYESDIVTIFHTLTIPVAIIDDPEAIVDHWNNDINTPQGWILFYDGTQYTMITPFDGTDYSGYIVQFNQYEGGVDSTINTTFIPQNFVIAGTRASVEIDIPDTFVGSKQAETLITPPLTQPFVTVPTLATAQMLIPKTIFSTVQQSATMNIEIQDAAMFGTTPASNKYFYYNATLMFNKVGPYADPAALVLDFNNNNGNGFNMTYIGPSTTVGYSIFKIDSPISGQPYNGDTVSVSYSSLIPFQPNVGTFAGGKSTKPLSLSVTDTLGLSYNVVSPSFSDVQDFISDFNFNNGLGYSVALVIGNVLFDRLLFTVPGPNTFIFNGTPITFTATDPTYTGGIYNNTVNYSGGIDTTECSYSLILYDSGNNVINTISSPNFNYPSLAAIVADINSNFSSPYDFLASVVSNQVEIVYPNPLALTCSTYNNYYFILTITYNSAQYIPNNYTSNQSVITGGVDAVSNGFVISDGINGPIFSQSTGNFNYPNGSEVQNGLIPDFNANNNGAFPLLYTAQYIGLGTPIPPQPSISSNNFITELTAATILNSQEIRAYIDNVYIGKYQAPVTGVLPSYNQMILNLTNNIIVNNNISGLGISSTPALNPTTIILVSPAGQEVAYNGKQFIINKVVYTPATISITFGSAAASTVFTLKAGLTTICTYNQLAPTPGTGVALQIQTLINSSGTNYTATRIGATVTISGPPFTGSSLNGVSLSVLVNQGSVVINSTTYTPSISFILGFFSGGLTTSSLIKQEPFAGGINEIPTTRVRFRSPSQPTISPQWGTGNWIYNSTNLSYDYNSGDYLIINGYSGGIDPTVGRLTVQVLDSGLNPLPPPLISNLYTDSTPQNYLSRQSLVNIFNNTNSFPNNFQINLLNPSSSICTIQSPPTSFDYFNTHVFRYSYEYVSSQSTGGQYADYINETSTFSGGVDPVLTPYEGEFQQGDIGTFVTENPCEPIVVEQECLSNTDITNIIKHIDRIIK